MHQLAPTLSTPATVPWLDVCATAWRPRAPGGGLVRQRWHDVDGRLVATGGTDGGWWWMDWPAVGTYVWGASGHVVVHAVPGISRNALRDSYTRGVVPVVLLARDCEALHASAVHAGGGVAAFCAVSGTGKSSLARAVAGGDFTHWADDTVVLRFDHEGAWSVALPCAPRIDPAAASAMPSPRDVSSVEPGTAAPLACVYLVNRDAAIDPGRPVVTSLRGSGCFERLLAHAHPFDLSTADRRRRTIERLLHVAATTPIFELRFAPSLSHLSHLAAAVRTHMRSN